MRSIYLWGYIGNENNNKKTKKKNSPQCRNLLLCRDEIKTTAQERIYTFPSRLLFFFREREVFFLNKFVCFIAASQPNPSANQQSKFWGEQFILFSWLITSIHLGNIAIPLAACVGSHRCRDAYRMSRLIQRDFDWCNKSFCWLLWYYATWLVGILCRRVSRLCEEICYVFIAPVFVSVAWIWAGDRAGNPFNGCWMLVQIGRPLPALHHPGPDSSQTVAVDTRRPGD